MSEIYYHYFSKPEPGYTYTYINININLKDINLRISVQNDNDSYSLADLFQHKYTPASSNLSLNHVHVSIIEYL